MSSAHLEESPVGELVRIDVPDPRTGELIRHAAFVPKPLPSTLSLSGRTHALISEASLELGRLDAATARLPNPRLVVRPTMRTEAVSTSAIEGTHAALEDVLEAEATGAASSDADVREVRNFIRAGEHGFEHLRSRPLSRALLDELQRTLVSGTRGDLGDAGSVRQRQVWIGDPTRPVTDARFVPPPPGPDLEAGLQQLVDWVRRAPDDIPMLARVALAHYQFEALHPYSDGNGRIGRLFMLLQLTSEGALRHPTLSISPWLEQRRDDYVDGLLRVSQTGAFDPWVSFLARAVRDQSRDGVRRTEQLLDLRDAFAARVRGAGSRGVAVAIAEDLVGFPALTARQAAERHGVSYQAANSAIDQLQRLGLLREATGRTYARVFIAPEVVEVLR